MGSYSPPAQPPQPTSSAPGTHADCFTAAAGPSQDGHDDEEHVEAAVKLPIVAAMPPLLTDTASTDAAPTPVLDTAPASGFAQ